MVEAKTGEHPALEAIQKNLMADYYMSFRHAQASVELQGRLFDYLALQYGFLTPSDLSEIDTNIKNKIASLQPPKKHIPLIDNTPNGVKGEFIAQWLNLLSKLEITKPQPQTQPVVALLTDITRLIIERDIRYLTGKGQERPRVIRDNSHLVDHALRQKPAGTHTYDLMYAQIGTLVRNSVAGLELEPDSRHNNLAIVKTVKRSFFEV